MSFDYAGGVERKLMVRWQDPEPMGTTYSEIARVIVAIAGGLKVISEADIRKNQSFIDNLRAWKDIGSQPNLEDFTTEKELLSRAEVSEYVGDVMAGMAKMGVVIESIYRMTHVHPHDKGTYVILSGEPIRKMLAYEDYVFDENNEMRKSVDFFEKVIAAFGRRGNRLENYSSIRSLDVYLLQKGSEPKKSAKTLDSFVEEVESPPPTEEV